MNSQKISIYEEITAKIITALEDGVNPWAKPWQSVHYGPFRNALTNRPYRGMNVLLLNLVALARSHVDPRWLTFRNAEQLGGHVRKGEKGASIVFWKFLPARDRNGDAAPDVLTDDEQERKLIPFARSYTVFNVEQCEGLDLSPLVEEEASGVDECNRLAEQILALPNLKHGGNKACYLPGPDMVLLPHRSSFEHGDFYYATGYHETVHWVGHPSRLNRVFGTRFGDLGYAFEELVAEIGAAFLGAHTGIPFENMRHPEYIHHWLQILQGDSKAIFTAAAKAQQAADFVLDKAGIVSVQEDVSSTNELPVAALEEGRMTNMRRFKIPVVFEFAGDFSIEAASLATARQCVQHHCGLTIGMVHSTLPADEVDWSFSCHPTKKVGKGCRCEEPITDRE